MNRALTRLSVVVLALLLVSAPAFAFGRAVPPDREPGLLAAVWQLLGRLVPVFDTARGTMDPDGSPSATPGASATDGDAHGTMDPNG